MLWSLRTGAVVCVALIGGSGFAGLAAIDVDSEPPDVIETRPAKPDLPPAPPARVDLVSEFPLAEFMPVSVKSPRMPAAFSREPVAVGVVQDRSALAVPLPAAVWPGLATVGALAVGLTIRHRRSRRAVS